MFKQSSLLPVFVNSKMSSAKCLLTRKETDLLLNGYIRRKSHNIFMPSVLIHIIHLFYSNLCTLKISGSILNEFLFCCKPIVTQLFNITDAIKYNAIKFRMGIYPNGIKKKTTRFHWILHQIKITQL